MGQTNRVALDRLDSLEVALELLSFSGGENTISEDQAMKPNEARVLENWEALSLGGMQRARGFLRVGDGTGAGYTGALDLALHHKDAGGTAFYTIIGGDLVKVSGTNLVQDDAAAFGSGVLSHGFSDQGGYAWITNTTNNLKQKAVGVAIATPSSQPPTACARVYGHKTRMIAEGSLTYPNRVYGCRAGKGNWTASDAWSLANDAFSIDLPDDTKGCVPDFPTGNEVLVFTERKAYAIGNFPNVAFRPIGTPSRGCSAPYSIALGDEGVYFVSRYPTLGVFRFNGVDYEELTQFNRDVFVETIDFSRRIFGIYRNRNYYLFYCNINNGVAYPDTCRVYDARFGRWMKRQVNSALLDTFGYPALLKYTNNELYVGSAQKQYLYQMETDDDSDNSNDTQATFTTKDFSSRDFAVASGGQFPIDDVKIKLLKAIITYYGTTGTLGLHWSADRGLRSGDKTISLTASGDLIGSTFIVGTSSIVTTPADKTVVITFPNNAVGRRFAFSLTNNGQSTRPKIKKVKIIGVAYDEA